MWNLDPIRVARDGVWTWFNDPRALVLADGSLLVGYVRSDGLASATRLNPDTGARHDVTLGSQRTTEVNDHNNPAFTRLPDGRILAVYSQHGKQSRYYCRVSRTPLPAGAEDWGDEASHEVSAVTTYANLAVLQGEGGTVYNIHRCLNWNPSLSRSVDGGATWSDPFHLIRTGTGRTRPYVKIVSNGQDRIDIFYTDGHPNDLGFNSIYHLFFRNGAFFRSDGSRFGDLGSLPLNHDDGARGTVVYQHATPVSGQAGAAWLGGRAWIWDAAYDQDGHPVCVFQIRCGDLTGTGWQHDRLYYVHARWTGHEWRLVPVAHAGRPLYDKERDYAGGIALDRHDPARVYLSSNALTPFAPTFDGAPDLAPGETYALHAAEVGAGSVQGRTVRATGVDCLRPYVASLGRTEALFWVEGTYSTYRTFETQIMAAMLHSARA